MPVKTIDDLVKLGLLKNIGEHVYIMVDKRTYNFNNPKGTAISTGDNSPNIVINNNNGVSEDILIDLLKQIDASALDVPQKEELKEIIEVVNAESNAEVPKKSVIRNLLATSREIIDTASKSPALIDAYQKWEHVISKIFTDI